MSRENIERIKAGFEAHNRGDVDALVEVYDPDAVFETLLLGTHQGERVVREQASGTGRKRSRPPG